MDYCKLNIHLICVKCKIIIFNSMTQYRVNRYGIASFFAFIYMQVCRAFSLYICDSLGGTT